LNQKARVRPSYLSNGIPLKPDGTGLVQKSGMQQSGRKQHKKSEIRSSSRRLPPHITRRLNRSDNRTSNAKPKRASTHIRRIIPIRRVSKQSQLIQPIKQAHFLSFERKFERLRIAIDPLLTERTEKVHACKVDLLTNLNTMKKQFMALSDDLRLNHGGISAALQRIETAIRNHDSYDEINSSWLNLRKVIGSGDDKLKLNASIDWKGLIKDTENQLVQFRQLDTFQSTWNALERAMDSADDPQAIQDQLVRFEKELNRTGIHPKPKQLLSHGQPHLFDPKNKTVQMVVQRSGQLRKHIEKHGKTALGEASLIDQWVALHHCGQLINHRFKQLSETVHDLLLEHKNNPSKHELSELEHEWRQLVRTIRSHKSYDEVVVAFKQFNGVVESDKYRDYREVQTLIPSIDAFRKALMGKDENRLPKIWFNRESRLQQSFEPVEILRSQWAHIPNGTKMPAHVQGAYQNLLTKLRAGTQAILPRVIQSAVDNMQQSLKDVQRYSPDIEQKDLDAIIANGAWNAPYVVREVPIMKRTGVKCITRIIYF